MGVPSMASEIFASESKTITGSASLHGIAQLSPPELVMSREDEKFSPRKRNERSGQSGFWTY